MKVKADEYMKDFTEVLALPLWNLDNAHVSRIGAVFAQNETVAKISVTDSFGTSYFQWNNGIGLSETIQRERGVFYQGQFVGRLKMVFSPAGYKKELEKLLYGAILTAMVSVFVIILMTGLLLRIFIRKPLDLMRMGMHQVAMGDFTGAFQDVAYSELAEIAERFSEMASKVQNRENDLKQINSNLKEEIAERIKAEKALKKAGDELELRVASRTAALREANVQLHKAKEAAEAATVAKSAFLANMSHEIRTPLNGVIAAVDLILNEERPPKLDRYFKIIESSAYTLLGIIEDVLDFSKIEAGKLRLEEKGFNPNEILDSVMAMFSNKATEKGINMELRVDGKIPKNLLGDPLRLEQILINLVSNAVKFTNKGVITISVMLQKSTPEGDSLYFSVKDTGQGILPEKLEGLFEAFTQDDVSTTRKYGGTGLGLSICKLLVEMMGGDIGAESNLGEGSLFYFNVNFKTAKGEIPIPANPPREKNMAVDLLKLDSVSILVAEDNRINQEIIKAILNDMVTIIDMAGNGEEAVSLFSRGNYDLILMDVQMPKMDGIRATKEIRALEKGKKHTPIVALTAHAIKGDREDCLRAGMDDYITKPVNRKKLLRTMFKFIHAEEAPKASIDKSKEKDFPPETGSEIDISEALSRLDMDMEKFESILIGFHEQNRNIVREISIAVEGNDLTEVRQLAHSLKGSAGNVGAFRLSDAAKDLETAAGERKEKDILQKILGKLNERLNLLAVSLEKIKEDQRANNPRPQMKTVDHGLKNLETEKLINALETSDPVEISACLEALRTHLEGEAIFTELEEQVDNYEYDLARKTLEQNI